MTALCVFGVSRMDCKRIAEKKVDRFDNELKRMLTIEEWTKRVSDFAQDLFATTTAQRQVSPQFDAPQFAHDWAELAIKGDHIKAGSIRVRTTMLDGEGRPIKRKGKLVQTWKHYEG